MARRLSSPLGLFRLHDTCMCLSLVETHTHTQLWLQSHRCLSFSESSHLSPSDSFMRHACVWEKQITKEAKKKDREKEKKKKKSLLLCLTRNFISSRQLCLSKLF